MPTPLESRRRLASPCPRQASSCAADEVPLGEAAWEQRAIPGGARLALEGVAEDLGRSESWWAASMMEVKRIESVVDRQVSRAMDRCVAGEERLTRFVEGERLERQAAIDAVRRELVAGQARFNEVLAAVAEVRTGAPARPRSFAPQPQDVAQSLRQELQRETAALRAEVERVSRELRRSVSDLERQCMSRLSHSKLQQECQAAVQGAVCSAELKLGEHLASTVAAKVRSQLELEVSDRIVGLERAVDAKLGKELASLKSDFAAKLEGIRTELAELRHSTQRPAGLAPDGSQLESLAATVNDHIEDFATARAELSLVVARHERDLTAAFSAVKQLAEDACGDGCAPGRSPPAASGIAAAAVM